VAIVGGGKSEEQAATEDQYEDEPLVPRVLRGVLELRPDRHDGSTWHLFEAYAWNLADAVPVLKVSQTLNWREPLTF
jgi:hypothetical protein